MQWLATVQSDTGDLQRRYGDATGLCKCENSLVGFWHNLLCWLYVKRSWTCYHSAQKDMSCIFTILTIAYISMVAQLSTLLHYVWNVWYVFLFFCISNLWYWLYLMLCWHQGTQYLKFKIKIHQTSNQMHKCSMKTVAYRQIIWVVVAIQDQEVHYF